MSERERADTKCLSREREREGEREGERERDRERERERGGAVFEYSCDTLLVTIYQSSYSSCRR